MVTSAELDRLLTRPNGWVTSTFNSVRHGVKLEYEGTPASKNHPVHIVYAHGRRDISPYRLARKLQEAAHREGLGPIGFSFMWRQRWPTRSGGVEDHSEDLRPDNEDFGNFAEDIALKQKKPVFAFGHSLGGLIVSQALCDKGRKGVFHGATLTSPAFGIPQLRGFEKLAAKLPMWRLYSERYAPGSKPDWQQPEPTPVYYTSDQTYGSKLFNHFMQRNEDKRSGGATVGRLISVARSIVDLGKKAANINVPVDIYTAQHDKHISVPAVRAVAALNGKFLRLVRHFENAGHELTREAEPVIDMIVDNTIENIKRQLQLVPEYA